MPLKANVRTPEDLFLRPVRYVVPAYQRRYVWSEEDQWEPLWEDVERLAEDYLDRTRSGARQISGDDMPSHFLGAVVLQQETVPSGEIETRRVIDGQQRLTTLQLLIDAAEEVFAPLHRREAVLLQDLVLNQERYTDGSEVAQYKVWPTAADQQDYLYAMRNDHAGDTSDDSRIAQAHDYFRGKVSGWLEQHADVGIAPQSLRLALSQMLQLVVIDLDTDAEPQIIFETLNARGTPLRQTDLVRNYIIFQAHDEGLDEDEFYRRWLEPLNDAWWQEEVNVGRVVRPRIEQFLFYWLTMRTSDVVRMSDLFSRFQRLSSETSLSIETVASDLTVCGQAYRALLVDYRYQPPAGWQSYLRFRNALQINLDAPLLLWLLVHEVPDHQRDRAVAAFESWLVRRTLFGRVTTGVNDVVREIIVALNRHHAERDVGDIVIECLKGQEREITTWTSDEDLHESLVSRPTYWRLSRTRVAFLLSELERFMRQDSDDLGLPANLQIEHIMPRKWERHWPLSHDTIESREEVRRLREEMVDTLGNLTLVTGKLNASVSNGPWRRKEAGLRQNSVLFLNKDVLEQGGDQWTLADIQERSRRLAEAAIKIWPGPDKF